MSHFVIFLNRSTELSNLAYFKQYSYFSHSCSQCIHSFPIHVHSFPIRVLSFPIRVHSCSLVFIRFHSCSFVFTRVHSCSTHVHSCSTRVHSCSLVFHSCSLVFIRVPLVFHSCSLLFTRVHSCSDLCGVLDMIKSAKVCLPLLPPISEQVIIQLGGYFSFISEYSRALSGVYKIAQLLPPKCTIT